MKIHTALVRDKHPAEGRSMYTVEKGDDLSFEAGLLTIRTFKGKMLVTPIHNVSWMEPVEKPKK